MEEATHGEEKEDNAFPHSALYLHSGNGDTLFEAIRRLEIIPIESKCFDFFLDHTLVAAIHPLQLPWQLSCNDFLANIKASNIVGWKVARGAEEDVWQQQEYGQGKNQNTSIRLE